MHRSLVLLFSILISTNIFAECSSVRCSDVNITKLYVRANGNTYIGTSGDESLLTCDSGTYGYITLEPGQANYNATYSLLLTAHTTGNPIDVRTTDIGECKILYVVSNK